MLELLAPATTEAEASTHCFTMREPKRPVAPATKTFGAALILNARAACSINSIVITGSCIMNCDCARQRATEPVLADMRVLLLLNNSAQHTSNTTVHTYIVYCALYGAAKRILLSYCRSKVLGIRTATLRGPWLCSQCTHHYTSLHLAYTTLTAV
eukprot:6319-Heterococcus_DN1.PRE.5